jgi:hypothetical protein
MSTYKIYTDGELFIIERTDPSPIVSFEFHKSQFSSKQVDDTSITITQGTEDILTIDYTDVRKANDTTPSSFSDLMTYIQSLFS